MNVELKPLKIILTACGCPGAVTLIRMLKQNGERNIEIIGTDMDSEAIGKFFCDKFYTVPSGSSNNYIPEIIKIVKKEQPDLIFPESSNEIIPLAASKQYFENFGVKIIVSSLDTVKIASNKYKMYEEIKKKTDVKLPRYRNAESFDEFVEALYSLGYPKKAVIFKPHIGKGSRGVRIIDPNANRRSQLLEEKPNNKFMSFNEFQSIFQDYNNSDFPKLLVMEYLEGLEKTADCLAYNGNCLLTTIKTVERARWGVITNGELVKDDYLIEQTREILRAIPLNFCVNLQFISGKLIEINPRVSTFIYQKNLIAPYLAIKLALEEIKEDEVVAFNDKIDYGLRMVRYMDQVFHKSGDRIF